VALAGGFAPALHGRTPSVFDPLDSTK